MKHCLYLFSCMTVRQFYGRRRRDLELGLYRWTTSEDWQVLGRWIALNVTIRKLCGVMMGVDERIDEGFLQWFGHVERMENDRIGKRVYVGECADICLRKR